MPRTFPSLNRTVPILRRFVPVFGRSAAVRFGAAVLGPALALTLALGCDESPVGPPEVIDELPRTLTADEAMVLARSNAFGLDLLAEVDARREADEPNTLLSPLSASMALGMAMEGADGDTYEAMRDALGFGGMSREAVNASYRGLMELLLELDPAVDIRIANSAWARQDFPFLPAYFNAITTHFDATVRELDFTLSGAENVINAWVEEKTGGHISEIVQDVDPFYDILFLINALYFKGDWTTRFKKGDTFQGSFRLADGTTVTVPTMSGEIAHTGHSGYQPERQVLALPYGGRAFEMVVVLPGEDESVDDVAAGLDAAAWAGMMEDLHYREIVVEMPKYELEWGGLLNDPLKAMGMAVAFDSETANFSRLTDVPGVFISRVRQKVYMKVDEEGTTAAAATSVGMGLTSAPPTVRVNRPFIVSIREKLSGTVLFLGIVRDPRS